MHRIVTAINRVGRQVFHDPSPLLAYEDLARSSLGGSTYRGFHKIDNTKKTSRGAKHVFEKVLKEKASYIIERLNASTTEAEIDELSRELCRSLQCDLKRYIQARQLDSFNKLRKPVDLVVEHLVAMGRDFSRARRHLSKHLFVPLDSQMFSSKLVFDDAELPALGIKRWFTFKDIEDESQYYVIQSFLKEKARRLGVQERIFWDLVWNERYKSKGKNLFATNPRRDRIAL
jgi:hypothetical protein